MEHSNKHAYYSQSDVQKVSIDLKLKQEVE